MGASSDYVLNISQRVQGNAPSELQKTLDKLNGSVGAVAKYEAALDKLSAKQVKAAAATAKAKADFGKLMEAGDASPREADAAWKAIEKAQKAEKRLAESAEDVKSKIKEQTVQVEKLADQYEKLKAAEDEANKAGGEGAEAGAKGGESKAVKWAAVLSIVEKVAKVIWEVGKAAARVVADLAGKLFEAATSIETMGAKFEHLLPGVGHGQRAFMELAKFAADYGLELQETTGWAEKLYKAKMTEADAKPYLLMAADLKAIVMEAGSVDAVVQAVANISKAGTMGSDSLSALGSAGLDTEMIVARLSSTTGKSVDEINKALTNGKVKASDALKVIQEVASPTGIGTKAAATANTLGGMWARIKGHAEEALLKIAEKALPKLQAVLGPLMERFTKWLDSPAAGVFFDDMATKIGELAASAGDFAGKLLSMLPEFASGAKGAVDAIGGIAKAAGLLADAFSAALNAKDKLFGSGGKRSEDVGPEIASRKGGLGDLAQKASKGAAAAAKAGGTEAGVAMGAGMAQGIMSELQAVTTVATLLAEQASIAAKAKLEAHSPSRVWERIGETMPQGMAGGIERGMPRVRSVVSQLVGAPAENNNASGGSRISVPHGPSVQIGTMNFYGVRDPDSTEKRVREAIAQALMDVASESEVAA